MDKQDRRAILWGLADLGEGLLDGQRKAKERQEALYAEWLAEYQGYVLNLVRELLGLSLMEWEALEPEIDWRKDSDDSWPVVELHAIDEDTGYSFEVVGASHVWDEEYEKRKHHIGRASREDVLIWLANCYWTGRDEPVDEAVHPDGFDWGWGAGCRKMAKVLIASGYGDMAKVAIVMANEPDATEYYEPVDGMPF